jgi:DNA polymerase-3 subunit delta'
MSCGVCQSCLLFLGHTHPNYHEIDIRTAGEEKSLLDPIRDLQNRLQQTAIATHQMAALPYHTVITIYPAELLHPAASDALLKTLEEPIQGVVFMLASNQIRPLSMTLRSRCQSIKLSTPTHEQAVQWIHNKLGNTPIDDQIIALSLQLTHYAPLQTLHAIRTGEIAIYQAITESFTQLFLGNKHPALAAQEWLQHDLHKVLGYLMRVVHELVKLKANLYYKNTSNLSSLSEATRLKLAELDIEALFEYWDILQSKQAEISQHHLNALLLLEYLAYQVPEISKK